MTCNHIPDCFCLMSKLTLLNMLTVQELRLACGSIKKEIINMQRNWQGEIKILGMEDYTLHISLLGTFRHVFIC